MLQRKFRRESAWVAVVAGVALVAGCGLFGSDESTDDDDDDANNSGRGGGAGAGFTGGTFNGGAAGTGISGSAGLAGSMTGGTGGTPGPTGGAGGAPGGAGGGGAVGGMAPIGDISWSDTGYIDMMTNTFGVNGSWYTYNDCSTAMPMGLPCTMGDPGLLGPDGTMGWMTTTSRVCAKGTAAQVMMRPDGGTVDYFGIQWGMGLAFDLANAGGTATAMPFNATAAGIAGFVFDVIGTAPMRVRINYVMPTTESTSHFLEVEPGPNIMVDFLSVNQGSWVMDPNRVAFDPTQLRTIQFQVFTNDMMPTPYDFCVSNVRVIRAAM